MAEVYRTLVASQLRSQTSYRASFAMDVFGSALVALTNLAEIYVVFANVPVFGGLDLGGALLMFAIAELAFGAADLVAGNLDTVPALIRTGTLDVMMLRPVPVLGQLMTNGVSLRRLGQIGLAAGILVVALARVDIDWTFLHVLLLVIAPISGAFIFGALFVLAGALQFWLIDGAELTNSFTYGSGYAASIPASVFAFPLRVFFGFVIPAAFVGYLPAIALLGQPGPAFLPAWLAWCSPVAAAAVVGSALLAWRSGVRHYAGAGG